MDGLRFGMFLHSPAAIHLGNLTTVGIIDERTSEQQRKAIEDMVANAVPFGVFMDLTSNFLVVVFGPIRMYSTSVHPQTVSRLL